MLGSFLYINTQDCATLEVGCSSSSFLSCSVSWFCWFICNLAVMEEVDSRSIYVGNVDYGCTSEELLHLFQICGTVNRVTIQTDQYGQPKGFAYIEFLEIGAVRNALFFNERELHGRKLKVCPKRTNIPGMTQYRGRRPFGSRFGRPSTYPSRGYGRFPRFRRPMRYQPY